MNHACPERAQRCAVVVAKIDRDAGSRSEAMFKQQAETALGDVLKSPRPARLARACGGRAHDRTVAVEAYERTALGRNGS